MATEKCQQIKRFELERKRPKRLYNHAHTKQSILLPLIPTSCDLFSSNGQYQDPVDRLDLGHSTDFAMSLAPLKWSELKFAMRITKRDKGAFDCAVTYQDSN